MKPFRVTREYFISDADLARFLGLSKNQVILMTFSPLSLLRPERRRG